MNIVSLDGTDFKLSAEQYNGLRNWLYIQSNYNELNEDSGVRSVWDSIDRPIRGLVYELNRIGLNTRFSCCGFSYEGEEEPKSHCRVPYIQFYVNTKDEFQLKAFDYIRFFTDKWNTDNRNENFYFSLSVLRNEENSGIPDTMLATISLQRTDKIVKMYQDKNGFALHDYEPIVILIDWLEKAIKLVVPSYSNEFVIVDGNAACYQNIKNWSVKPKHDKVFSL